tara:strand:- start:179 stop:517 length:339 start_codon:yes stop_codon:yes gene_type:complete
MKKYFFGWKNIKWIVRELRDLYSDKSTYFSKKRVESGVAFLVGQFGMIYWLSKNIDTLSSSDIVLWAGVEFAIAGYMVNAIQKEKKDEVSEVIEDYSDDNILNEEDDPCDCN